MAVKARAEITIIDHTDVDKFVTWYVKTTTQPDPPTTTVSSDTPDSLPGGEDWTTTEPTVSSSADLSKSVYACVQTCWKDGTCEWSVVVKSSSYEAAKIAWNLANSAHSIAAETEKYFKHDSQGAHVATVGNNVNSGPNVLIDNTGMTVRQDTTSLAEFTSSAARIGALSGNNVLIDSDSVDIRDGTDVLASFGATTRIGAPDEWGHILIEPDKLGLYIASEYASEDPKSDVFFELDEEGMDLTSRWSLEGSTTWAGHSVLGVHGYGISMSSGLGITLASPLGVTANGGMIVNGGMSTEDTEFRIEVPQNGNNPHYRFCMTSASNIRVDKSTDGVTWTTYGYFLKELSASRVLWPAAGTVSGGYYMTASQTATLTETVSSQNTGIVLVWSRYNPSTSTVLDSSFHTQYIPKALVAAMPGKGYGFMLGGYSTALGYKYIYVYNNRIVGHDDNNKSETTGRYSNVNWYNNYWVLRAVIGV